MTIFDFKQRSLLQLFQDTLSDSLVFTGLQNTQVHHFKEATDFLLVMIRTDAEPFLYILIKIFSLIETILPYIKPSVFALHGLAIHSDHGLKY